MRKTPWEDGNLIDRDKGEKQNGFDVCLSQSLPVILRSLLNQLRRNDWFVVLVEIFLLAVGLLTAFQVDRWWEQRADREKEHVYIQRLIDNIEADIPQIKKLIETQSLRLDYADLLIQVVQNPELAAERPGEFLAAVIGASYTNYPTLRSHTFEDLRSTGNMALIRSSEVKAVLYEYYDFDRSQGNFRPLYLFNEFRHWELAAGVLGTTQAQWLQNNRIFALPANVSLLRDTKQDLEEVIAAANRLASKQELVDWLPQIREMQIYFIFSMERQLARAEDVLVVLRDYADKVGTKSK